MPLPPVKKDRNQTLSPTPKGIILKKIDPLSLSPAQLNGYKEAKKNAFMTYHHSLSLAEKVVFAPENYYNAFTAALCKFEETPTACSMFSATDQKTQCVLGGLLGEKKLLTLPETDHPHEIYTITYLFVEPTAQQRGIGTALVRLFLNSMHTTPCILAVRYTHLVARKLYEKCGFTLVTDATHPDGRGTPLVHTLLEGPGYIPHDFVAYCYTPSGHNALPFVAMSQKGQSLSL